MSSVAELSREEQLAFNRKRWEEICRDPHFSGIDGKFESNSLGQVIVMPPASGKHRQYQGEILFLLRSLLGGIALPECPISTMDGVRAADVGWYSKDRFAQVEGQQVFEVAPEISVEALSPDNTRREMEHKKPLYFDAGATEFWICRLDGTIEFHCKQSEDRQTSSRLCPGFPKTLS